MTELLVGILLSVFFVAHFVFSWLTVLKNERWFFALVVTVTFLTPWMSHLWHVLYDEDRIERCSASKLDEAFGWSPCFEATYNTFVNTYEITLVLEGLFFAALGFYVLYTLFKRNLLGNSLVFLLNTGLLVLTIMLMLASPNFLDDFQSTFNWVGFGLSIAMWILVEVYLRLPYFGYQDLSTV